MECYKLKIPKVPTFPMFIAFDMVFWDRHLDVEPKIGVFPPKSSHLFIGFSLINHPFWGTTIFGNTHLKVEHHFTDFTLIYLSMCHLLVHSQCFIQLVVIQQNGLVHSNFMINLRTIPMKCRGVMRPFFWR